MRDFLQKSLVFLISSLSLASSVESTIFDQGVANIGAHLAAPISYNRHQEFNLAFKVSPYFGYFFINNLELREKVSFERDLFFSSRESLVSAPIFWGLSLMLIYYFNTVYVLKPYIGAGLGYHMMNFSIFSSKLIFEIPIGVLIELGKKFALDLGVPVRLHVSIRSMAEKVEFNLASIGIRYAF